MENALRALENSATNTVSIDVSDKELGQLLQHTIDNLRGITERHHVPMDFFVLVILPYARWEKIEPQLDTKYIVHVDEAHTVNVRGFTCAAVFADKDMLDYSAQPLDLLPSKTNVQAENAVIEIAALDTALNCGLAVFRNYVEEPIAAPLGMRILV